MAALTQTSMLNCITAGAVVGAAGGALAECIYQSFHSGRKKIVENYQKQVEELRDTPLWSAIEQYIPDNIFSLDSSEIGRLVKNVNQVYKDYHNRPGCISADQAATEFVNDINHAIEKSRQQYKNSNFVPLEENQIESIRQYVRKHFADNEMGFFCQAEVLSDSLAKTNIYITRFPAGPAMQALRAKWEAVKEQYEEVPSDTGGSLLGYLTAHDIPFFHVNPDLPIHQYWDYAKPSLPSQRSGESETLEVATKLRKRAISKKTDVASTPVEPVHSISKEESQKEPGIIYSPTFNRQRALGFPDVCNKRLAQIKQDLKLSRETQKKINRYCVYHVSMGDSFKKGPWRLFVKLTNTHQGINYEFVEICDYHGGRPTLWGAVQRALPD
ncbi:hypothetical protein [Pseudomonas sp. 65/3-MNA-CIBAN-0223]|uniref:hypothetical protein n=1 Tax=Pseudomonas sp. 65/3-MNA-CIBAN-0223 TaxID=3140476 RepID=UPI0033278ACF